MYSEQINLLRGDSINSLSMATTRAVQKHSLSWRRDAVSSRELHCRKKFTLYVFVDIFNPPKAKISLDYI
jgi:hypothetical protein